MEENSPNLTETPEPGRWTKLRKWLGFLSFSRIIRWAIILTVVYWVYNNWHNDVPLNQLMAQYAYPDSQFMDIEGMPVHYRICGAGEPIVLLHDQNSSLRTWEKWTQELSKNYQVISVDLPGFGLTGPHPQGSYSAFMYASFFEQFVRELGLEKFHLAGNGLGAQIAWFYASENPAKLKKLILLDAPGYEKKESSWIVWLARTPIVNRVMWTITPRYFLRIMLEDMYADDAKVTEEMVQKHFDLMLRPGNRKAFTDRAQVSDNRPPVKDFVEKIKTPTMILWGAEDTRISPEFAYVFHQQIQESVIRIYQNTGHWPQEENAELTAREVQEFLTGKF